MLIHVALISNYTISFVRGPAAAQDEVQLAPVRWLRPFHFSWETSGYTICLVVYYISVYTVLTGYNLSVGLASACLVHEVPISI